MEMLLGRARCPGPIGLAVATDPSGHPVVHYLGYRLPLSDAEARVVACLVAGGGRDVPIEDLCVAAGGAHPASADTVTVLVGRINRKAKRIGGRVLIHGRSHHGFSLAEDV